MTYTNLINFAAQVGLVYDIINTDTGHYFFLDIYIYIFFFCVNFDLTREIARRIMCVFFMSNGRVFAIFKGRFLFITNRTRNRVNNNNNCLFCIPFLPTGAIVLLRLGSPLIFPFTGPMASQRVHIQSRIRLERSSEAENSAIWLPLFI